MRTCSRCILTDQYPEIQYDEKGVCHKCHEYDVKYAGRDFDKLRRELEATVEWARRQNKRYDCIVPFSGGKDSSYTLYVCREEFGLKALAVNFDNGLRTMEALENLDHIAHKLGAAFACYGPPWETMRKLYRAFFLATGQFCVPCDMGIWATVHRMAEQYDVPLIVSGFSAQIESRGAKIYSYNNTMFRRIASGILSEEEMRDFLGYSKADAIKMRLKHGSVRRRRRQISLPDYIPWEDAEIKRVIGDVLQWKPRADGSTDHIDCHFAPIKGFLNRQKWGFGEKTTKFAAMVRAGQMTRDQALARAAEEESKPVDQAVAKFREWLDLSEQDILDAPTKTHLDYLS